MATATRDLKTWISSETSFLINFPFIYLFILYDYNTLERTIWSRSNALDLYSTVSRFESWEHTVYPDWGFRDFLSIYLSNYLSVCLSVYLSTCLSMALQPLWTLAAFSVS
jgi:hypothetical protein